MDNIINTLIIKFKEFIIIKSKDVLKSRIYPWRYFLPKEIIYIIPI